MEQQKRFMNLPGAIIIAGAIIAIAIIFVKKPVTQVPEPNTRDNQNIEYKVDLAPITAKDHIYGNPSAPIKIVEYSDTSCPYCKVFNATMVEIMNEYGPKGQVAWVYRSYPLDKPTLQGYVLHQNAGHEAQALECAASLGGNDKFWDFEKLLYETTPSVTSKTPEGLDQKQLPVLAKNVGLDPVAFNDCVSSGKFKAEVESQFASGQTAGVTGTPANFVVLSDTVNETAAKYIENALVEYRVPADILHISADKKIIVMNGAMPKNMISGLIDTLLK